MAAGTGRNRPPFDEIAADLRKAIATGAMQPGSKLPSNSELKARYEVAGQTAQRAINALKSEGLVYSVPGRGVFVQDDVDPDELLARLAKADGDSSAYARILDQLQVVGDQIGIINDRLDEIESRIDAGQDG